MSQREIIRILRRCEGEWLSNDDLQEKLGYAVSRQSILRCLNQLLVFQEKVLKVQGDLSGFPVLKVRKVVIDGKSGNFVKEYCLVFE